MNSNRDICYRAILAVLFGLGSLVTQAQMPSDFPLFSVTNRGGVAPGSLIGNLGGLAANGTKNYYVVLDNSGTNALFYSKTQALSKFVMPNGLIAMADLGISGYNFLNENLTKVDSFSMTEGYSLDSHDVKLLSNGHVLLMGREVRAIDMSQVVPGGRPDAVVTGNVVQEIDAAKHVVFEWHTFDHIPITNSFYDLTQKNIDYAHINSVAMDPTDNNILISLRTTSEIVKIDRRTGEVIWRLGGKANEFTFIGEHPENAPFYTVGQHDVHRLANGNLLYFDNGNISGGGLTPSDRTYSRAVEYALDETNKTAILVWEFRHTPDISAPCTGSVKRFANGNTLVEWGCAIARSGTIATEVSPAGEVLFEISFPQAGASASLTKQVWDSPDLTSSWTNQGIVPGETYDSGAAGLSMKFSEVSGPGEKQVVASRHFDGVRFPQFEGTAPQVLAEHATILTEGMDSFSAEFVFDLPRNDFTWETPLSRDPASLIVYHRPVVGTRVFKPLPSTYNPSTKRISVIASEAGEYIFGYPDPGQVPLQPVQYAPSDRAEVNQDQPVSLKWGPRGTISGYQLQVASDPEFKQLAVNTNLPGSSYLLESLTPSTVYYWRVNARNDSGTSEWSGASFTTAAPYIQVTAPKGGEVWQRGVKNFIRWQDNIAENVIIDLYKGGTLLKTLATNSTTTASQWQVGLTLTPGADYAIGVRSATNAALAALSPLPFSIVDAPQIDASSMQRLPGGSVRLPVTAPGAATATLMSSADLLSWQVLQTMAVTNDVAVFTDGTAPSAGTRFYRAVVP